MRVTTWNVNSLRVRLAHVLDWLDAQRPDVLCLQETKLPDEEFPLQAFLDRGYQAVYSGQKTYNGVAIITREGVRDPCVDLPGTAATPDPQRRLLAATYQSPTGPVRVVNVYVPNGQSVESDKFAYKLDWLTRLRGYLAEQLTQFPHLVLVGDFNIAPEPRDVHNPKRWEGKVLFSEPERAAFRQLLELGLVDTFRLFEDGEGHYSWWDYRLNAFQRGWGLRIDHVLASGPLAARCRAGAIDTAPRALERPSDHAPAFADFDLAEAVG
ncbi:exodeoxyribonuclease III [Ectothiorhodospiraceae bacterium 2226]|nr:exodeoxyribonuclease III [Ectothiorhodospiraceae bacterium 2226]